MVISRASAIVPSSIPSALPSALPSLMPSSRPSTRPWALPSYLPSLIPISIASGSDYKFDLRNINAKSLRFYTTKELEPSDEHSEMSRIYYGFETGDSFPTGDYPALKADLDVGKSPCPEGWRVPNVREGALMALYCSSDWWNTGGQGNIIVSSYYSNGTLGNKHDTESPSWQFGHKHASIGVPEETGTRCVRDYLPPSMQ